MTIDAAPIAAPAAPTKKMRRSTRLLFFLIAWMIVLMPFLFWRSTWFGRPLTDAEITEYLRDDTKPRRIQHALVQIGERIARGAPDARLSVVRWYPELLRLAAHPVEEIRSTDAWLMGQDPSRAEFHQALVKMLADSSTNVRSNAALSLVRFGDSSGHDQIVAMLQPAVVRAPAAGRIAALAKAGEPIRTGTMLARLEKPGGESVEARSPITGKVKSVAVRAGDSVESGAELASVAPGAEQVWEALRALYLIGRPDDLPLVRAYQQASPDRDFPANLRQQAALTEKAILQRASQGTK